MKKYIAGTDREPLAGVAFKITDGSGAAVGNTDGVHYTDDSGEITIENLEKGAVLTVREVATKDGFVLDGTPKQVEIQNSDVHELVFWNARQGSLTIRKLDSVTQKPLEGVTFKITSATGEYVPDANGKISSNGLYKTDAAGEIVLTGVVGTFVVTETETIPGYTIHEATRSQTVVVNADDSQVLTFYNDPTQTLTVRKFAAGTSDPIPGVRFKVTSSDGTVIGANNGLFVTDESGSFTIDNLTPGVTITAQEIETVSGFVLDSTPKSILIKRGEAQFLSFYNEKKGTLVVEKRDSTTNEPLEGAEFLITTIDGTFVDDAEGAISTKGIYKTDAHGQIVLRNLLPDTYVVTETKAPNGYVLDNEKQTVKVNAADTQTITFTNTPLQNAVIEKYAEDTGKPLSGVTFLITDGAGNPVGSANGEHTTDANGRITLTGLVPGTTIVAREVRTVKGYVLNGQPQTIVVGTNAASRTSAAVATSAASSGENALKFYDAPLSTLIVSKFITGTTTPIAGARFLITGSDGGAIGNTNGEYRTDANGQIILKDLQPGITVTAKEIEAAEGYVLDSTPKSIEIKSGDVQELNFYNSPTGSLTIIKKDRATGAVLKGATFQLTYANGAFVGSNGGKTTSNGSYTTDENGQIIIKGLNPSTIIIRETKAPDGYSLNDTPVTVEVAANDAQTVEIFNDAKQTLTIQKFVTGTTNPIAGVRFLVTDSRGSVVGSSNGEFTTDRNGRIVLTGLTPGTTITAKELSAANGFVLDTTPQSILIKQGESQVLTFYNTRDGGLELIKVDAADKSKRIPNTTFEIRRMDQGLVTTVTTDRSGRVHVDLDAGDYYLVETEAAKGYKLDETPVYFTVVDGRTTTVTVKNKAFSGIEIHKVDAITGEGIYGVSFLVYDAKNNVIGQYTSDDRGYVRIEGLDAGRYRIREMENPGYVVDTQLKTVEVKSGEVTLVEWKNTPITGQIQITKTSADYNSMNGWPAGTPIPNTVFEVYNRAGNLVDTIKTDKNGVAATKPLPLGRYKVMESKAADFYGLDKTPIEVEIEFAGQIVRAAMTNKSLYTNVSITKRGYAEVMPGQSIRYDFSNIANNSTTALESFYFRDTIPTAALRLDKVITGTWNANGNYKIVYKTNLSNGYRTLADNLSTGKNYVLNASPATLGLASNEYVTEIMYSFGVVPANFRQVEAPQVYCTVLSTLTGGTQFTNTADVGGAYNGQWIMAVDRWTTNVYQLAKPLPRTGY